MAYDLDTRPKSPTRAEAIAIALRPKPVYSNGVLLGNWVEDRTESTTDGLYMAPKDDTETSKLRAETRQSDFRRNKLHSIQGNINQILHHDSHDSCGNYTTTNDLVYRLLPKPLCGPDKRYYRRAMHIYYPQPDLLKCFGNMTEWGLRAHKQYEWACTDVSDYTSSLYEDTFHAPLLSQYLNRCERKARDSSFTKSFRFLMTKPRKK